MRNSWLEASSEKKTAALDARGSGTGRASQHVADGGQSYFVQPIIELIEVSIADVVDNGIDSHGPVDDFVYLDIGAVDRETKAFVAPKSVSLAKAPSRAKQRVHAGDVLVSMTRPNLNAVAQVTQELLGSIASTGFHVLRSPWLEGGFLYYLVQTDGFVDAMCGVVKGALYPAVRPRDIEGFKFHLPPRAEQTRIVGKLEELLSDLDAGVAELKAAQCKLAQYRQSLLKAAVEGALTADWRAARAQSGEPQETGADLLQRILTERRVRWETKQLAKFAEQGKTPPKDWQSKYPEPVLPETTNLPELRAGWSWASLDQVVAESLLGLDRGQDNQSPVNGNAGYVKMNNVSMAGGVDTSSLVKVDATREEIERYSLVRGDLLFNTRNSRELVGKTGMVREADEATLYNNNLMRLRFDGAITPAFLCHQMCASGFRGRMEKVKKATTSVAAVYAKDLFPLPVVICPMDEQVVIGDMLAVYLDAVDEQDAAVQRGLRQATAQRKNILKTAFAGQLVPQDPNDEPASALLERIRAERISGGAKHSGKNGRKPREKA
jgi:Restriction endonuclease S subunits